MHAIVGKTVILAPYNAKSASSSGVVTLGRSGSSANVALVPGADGRRQALFLRASEAVKKTSMFIVPLEVNDKGDEIIVVLDSILSHSFAELIFANVSASPALAAIADLLAHISTFV